MRICRVHDFGPVEALEVGWSPIGRPIMTAFCFRAGPVMVDTGIRHTEREVINWALESRPDLALLTHHHEDHSGNGAALRRTFGMPVYAHPETVRRLRTGFSIRPYQHVIWGRAESFEVTALQGGLDLGRWKIVPIHTPGHSPDHTVYWVPEEGWLFSGDLYLGDHIKFFRADERIDQQMSSIRKILDLDFEALWCGHRPRPREGKRHLASKLAYLEDVYGKVARLWAEGLPVPKIMRELGLKEAWPVWCFTLGDAGMRNLVGSVVRAEEEKGSGRASREVNVAT
ncbi:MAG: MBL fold metallo-hydrolase [Desulfobacteraceae bacterium]